MVLLGEKLCNKDAIYGMLATAQIVIRSLPVKYRQFPGIDQDISILGFGCMRLPRNSSDDSDVDVPRSKQMIRAAIDQGVNYIDTAWTYHGQKSELILADVLADGYRERVFLTTKLPSWIVESREHMDELLEKQLEKLNTPWVDGYLVHSLDRKLWNKLLDMGLLDFLDSVKTQGKAKYIGFSFHDTNDVFTEIIDAYPWDICQIQYNYLDTDMQAGTKGLSDAHDRGIGVVVMEPLRGGMLTMQIPESIQRHWDAYSANRSPAEWALKWVWNDPRITVVLSGMSTEEQLEENLATADAAEAESLTPTELQVIEAVKSEYEKLIQIPCTGCGYCMPCPFGVRIPEAFHFYNDATMFNAMERTRKRYNMIFTDGHASKCTACGRCEPLCPQHIEIIASLETVAQAFGE